MLNDRPMITFSSASLTSMRCPTTYLNLIGLSLSVSRNNSLFLRQYIKLNHFRKWSLCSSNSKNYSSRQVIQSSGCVSGIKCLNTDKYHKFSSSPYKILRNTQHFYLRNHHLSWPLSFSRAYSTSQSSSDEIYEEVADMIKCNTTNILVMAGAGMSTPSGIPDFRTPGTGLYDNLQKYRLPYPEAIFDIHYFMMDPKPFIVLAQELYPGVNYKPNIAHYFIRLLLEKQKLQKLYTQNIDGLERIAGIPETKLMEAHGTFATASCTLCNKIYPGDKAKQAILDGEVPLCSEAKCKVYPFAGIADAVKRQTPRVLINRELVGSFGTRENDYMLLGDLTSSVERLIKAIGWENDLKDLMKDL
ncbi:NAD-dependent protein deacetylase sirtuin-3-like isoform X2 [Palaemon carinicauda]|uniref:NAD-dependent protein deacetylase sirtuin-3-like isoform X2 n=1 Tax=Palaemon carinicauda TaxID=392227 RepID=UPI0035B5A7DE